MESPSLKYQIFTTTSNFPDAGFSSNVYIQIFGVQKNSSSKKDRIVTSFRFPLQTSMNNAKKFRPGQTDLFEVDLGEIELQSIKKLRFTHDSRNSRWHLKHVVIRQKEGNNKTWKFKCGQWIDGSTFGVELSPLKRDSPEYESIKVDDGEDRFGESDDERDSHKRKKDKNEAQKTRYKVKIVTSEISKIEPDLKIKFKIIGKDAQTDWIRVEEFPMIHIFKAEETDVGMIDRLLISCKNKEGGKPFDWFFDEIVVAVHKFKTFTFSSKGRTNLTIDKEKNCTLTEVYVSDIKDISKKLKYTVSFYPRTHPLASNELVVKLFGEFGNSGEFKAKLFKSEIKSTKLFDKSVVVSFSQKFFDFGKVYKIDLGLIETKHAKTDLDSLSRSFIVVTYDRRRYSFFFIKNKSIKKDEEKSNMVKVAFYEQEYMKQRFADELVHDMLFDDPKQEKDRQHKKSAKSGSLDSLRHRKYDDDYSDSFESSRSSSLDRRSSSRRMSFDDYERSPPKSSRHKEPPKRFDRHYDDRYYDDYRPNRHDRAYMSPSPPRNASRRSFGSNESFRTPRKKDYEMKSHYEPRKRYESHGRHNFNDYDDFDDLS